MLITLALVVLFAAIMVFFSQEFIRTFKKIFAIKGAKLVLPLAAASWLVYNFDYWCLWVLYYIREVLNYLISLLSHIMPFHQYARSLSMIVLLTILSVVPVLVIDVIHRRRTYKPFAYPYLTSTLIWIVSTLLLIVVI